MGSIIDALAGITKKLGRATSEVTSEIQRLRAAIVAKRAELRDLARSNLPLAEAVDRVRDVVERDGAVWLQAHGTRLLAASFSRARALAQPGTGLVMLPWSSTDPVPWGALAAAEPARAEALLTALLRRLKEAGQYVEGVPSAERPALVAKLSAELAEIEAAEERIIDEAAAAGVEVKHRREVLARRENEARRLQLEEQRVANRKARQDAVDAEHEGTRTTRSKYLATAAGLGPDRLP